MSNGTEYRGKSIHWPPYSTKACFMVAGNITTSVNKGRQAGPMSGLHFDDYICCFFLPRSHHHLPTDHPLLPREGSDDVLLLSWQDAGALSAREG